jgi:hypothetical protein
MRSAILLARAALVLASCGGGGGKTDGGTDADSASVLAPANAIDLGAHGMPLVLNAPDKQLTGGQEPAIVWKDQTGVLEVRAGDHFGLLVIEEPGDIARKKADLDRDLLRKHTILKETPDLLVYRSEFPDDPSLVYIRFHQLVHAGDRHFVVEDIPELRFNEQDVERMVGAIAPKQPA